MSEIRQLSEVAEEVSNGIEKVGLCEYVGLEEIPHGRRVDAAKCRCGGGCESLLECRFWYWLRKTPDVERLARRQVKIGGFRVDSLIEIDGQDVVVELDGKRWHQGREMEDWLRDKSLLESVDAIIRIPYPAITFYPHATFSVLASWYRRFSIKGKSITCLNCEEFNSELNQFSEHSDRRMFVDQVDLQYELWTASENFGWVGSPKAWMNRFSGNTKRITRWLKRHKSQ